MLTNLLIIRRRGVVGRVLPSNPAGSGILISVLGLGVCPLSVFCIISGGGPVIVLTTHSEIHALVYLSSVLVNSLLLPLEPSDPRAFGL